MTSKNPLVINPYVSPHALVLPTQPQIAAATPGAPTNMTVMPPPFKGAPYTEHFGLQLIYPLQKQYVTGAMRRVIDSCSFNNGIALANSTAYPSWLAIPRNCTITGAWIIFGVVPTAGVNSLQLLAVSSAGTTILTSASFNPLTGNAGGPVLANTLFPLPLLPAGSALLDFFSATAAPPALYVAYNAGVQGTAAQNVALFVEYEMDDF